MEENRKLQGKFVPASMPVLKVNERYVSDPKCVAESLAHFANVSSAAHYSHVFNNFDCLLQLFLLYPTIWKLLIYHLVWTK